jgi:transposase
VLRSSITELVGVVGWRVKGEPMLMEQPGRRPRAMFELNRERAEYRCPCGRVFRAYYDGDFKEVWDLPFGRWDASLLFFQVRVECPKCGVKTEALDWLEPGRRYTQRFADYVARLCRLASVSAVADHLGLDWKTVKRFDQRALEKELNPPNLEGVRVLVVDELAIRKGHRYATLMVDFETRRVLWAVEGRREEALGSFYELLGPERCAAIQAVAMDMWQPYMNATVKYCPKARIVFDPFHVLSNFSKVINKVRNAEYKRAKETDKAVLKGTKYLLLKNWENLKAHQKRQLNELLDLNKALNTVYILKDQLKRLWTYSYPGAAWNFFQTWYDTALEAGLQPLKAFADSLKNHWDGIVAHCTFPIHTSLLEGINNKAKVIKRIAYGFHHPQYYFLKLRAAFPGH